MAEGIDPDLYASSFVRVKYRDPPINPRLNNVRENVSISLLKKVAPPEIDPYADMAPVRIVPPVFFPGHTQKTRKEKSIVSDEAMYRESVRPNMYERMELEQKHHKVKHERDKAVRKREAMKAKLDEDLNRMREEGAAANREMEEKEKEENYRKVREAKERKAQGFWGRFSGKKKTGVWGSEATGSAKEKQDKEAAAKDMAANEAELKKEEEHKKLQESGTKEKQEDGDGTSSSDSDEDGGSALNAYEKAQFAEAALQLKEQKLVRIRNSKVAYNTIPHSQVRWFATKMAYGLGKREPNVTQVLPWLWVGNAAYAQQLQYLMKLGITHVMNVTADVGNHYPQHFVYQRIPMNDENTVDAIARFPAAVDFIKRVWQCRGRVYVHCSMGVSRAPAVVMAYLIKEKHLSLNDAFSFLKAVRPKCAMNNKFLLDLAYWEGNVGGEGSSVLHHHDWQFYEYNMLKADPLFEEYRQSIGVYDASMYLWKDLKRPEDFFE